MPLPPSMTYDAEAAYRTIARLLGANTSTWTREGLREALDRGPVPPNEQVNAYRWLGATWDTWPSRSRPIGDDAIGSTGTSRVYNYNSLEMTFNGVRFGPTDEVTWINPSNLQTAYGEGLDHIGSLYEVPRKVEDDAAYRQRLHRTMDGLSGRSSVPEEPRPTVWELLMDDE